ncbi:MAG TPA: hypothetical protein VGZ93_05120 [Candidatus Methylacidiphilales bacterium]|jgi:hypothetical protein|nr:hypothetical protein [Candidatus Methylacidiphilales bacterium]
MPADIKTHPSSGATSLEGAVFTFQSEADRVEAIDKAFDYRGDVTLTLRNEQVEGYMFNRDARATPPRVEVFAKGAAEPRVIPYADITAIAFTGKDTADGKSWAAWVSKKEHERQAEADRIKAEAEAQGHL